MPIDIDELLQILPRLIRENDTVKGAIITALSGVVATRDDIKELIAEMDKRFEAVDRRFEALQKEMDRRFEAVDRRFEALQKEMDRRFEAVDRRFEAIELQLHALTEKVNAMPGVIIHTLQESVFKPWETRLTLQLGEMKERLDSLDR
ncbi:MAG: hypothetical protein ACTSU5_11670 [Promethearchaeota archaeon]